VAGFFGGGRARPLGGLRGLFGVRMRNSGPGTIPMRCCDAVVLSNGEPDSSSKQFLPYFNDYVYYQFYMIDI